MTSLTLNSAPQQVPPIAWCRGSTLLGRRVPVPWPPKRLPGDGRYVTSIDSCQYVHTPGYDTVTP
ncbi:hypothetical protein C2E23DRAFT_830982 [Lenzites betulinus]|nr:hypothetical protein C2E23DRAFT_830982 [Lenzites betulinus]